MHNSNTAARRKFTLAWRHMLNVHNEILFAIFVINYKTSEYEIFLAYIC